MTTVYTIWQSPLCNIVIAAQHTGLTHLHLKAGQTDRKFTIQPHWNQQPAAPLLQEAIRQLEEYFSGKRTLFSLPLHPTGTDFQQATWRALQQIPYGETRSYQQIAEQIGHPKAVRAVGTANGKNPLPLLIPCHRVITSSGKLGGFAAGIDIKRKLLDLEAGVQPVGSPKISPLPPTIKT